MRKIQAEITRVGLSGYELRIFDSEAKDYFAKNTWVDFSPDDVLKKANRELAKIGIEAVV